MVKSRNKDLPHLNPNPKVKVKVFNPKPYNRMMREVRRSPRGA